MVSLLRIFSYAWKYKFYIMIALILMFIELVVDLVQPFFISKVIDDGIVAQDINTVWFYLGVMLLVSLIAFTGGIFNSYFSSFAANMFSYDLRRALFNRIQYFSLGTLSKFQTSSLITRLTQDVLQVEMLLYMSLRIVLRAPLLVFGSLAMAFVVNPTLGFYLSMLTPVLLIFLFIVARFGAKIFMRVQKRIDQINRFIQQNLEAVRLIKANDRGEFESNRFQKVAARLRDDTMYALRLMETIMPVLLIIMNGSILIVIWFASDMLQNNAVQVGEVVAVINYGLRMQNGFGMFAFIIMAFSRAKASSDRMNEVLDAPINTDDKTPTLIEDTAGTVEFNNVSFRYPGTKKEVLKNITFRINPNEKFVIMGGTGAGKSTLLSLIPRMYKTTEGSVIVNDKNVEDWNEDDLRQTIGYVPQSSTLFSGSIYENLLWGDLEALEEDVMVATQRAQIHDNIKNFDNQYRTIVGQRGVTLSGGQKQRLSIARALVRKPSILILDDSTSALDIKTENALWEALKDLNATRVIVTQKVITAKTADRILLLDKGEISAIGSHDELMNTSKLYQEIVESQSKGGSFDD
ncbi:ATP-binding cassette, subfamily B [Aliicoccus persicus]|uniref:ATP-binding cassette, subfamily B n=2 Tax=Aliicoccus persicus TaxID=930138 RepID=A0A662Z0R7_9STAP|nr:ATP-binding cassette, subfamily B [Aliicoccus persicus]